ncbi:uncharacterized protein BDW70DRAFT_171044 [Aspergillus foveolatus]|uniref:uncharacterized protein n=1 Tax=Aspergillus foveolatus TaxID=210207 RepID=UPI003CCD8CDC
MAVAASRAYCVPRPWNIQVGESIAPPAPPVPAAFVTSTKWTIMPGIYTPRQLVHGFAPLFNTVIHHTRESSLPFPSSSSSSEVDQTRAEIRGQANHIGQSLVQWATADTDNNESLDLLMFGPRSKPHLMQLFNEYMHQMVLLRDSLLPSANYEDVRIPITDSVDKDGEIKVRGLRFMAAAREKFMARMFTKQVARTHVVELARALLVPGLAATTAATTTTSSISMGYGFQYKQGLTIPALFTDSTGVETPLHLLQYFPAHVAPSHEEIIFDYEFADYHSAPKLEIPLGTVNSPSLVTAPQTESPRVQVASLALAPALETGQQSLQIRQLDLRIELDNGQNISLDLGQIARGKRYSYGPSSSGDSVLENSVIRHAAHEIHGIVALAVLGKTDALGRAANAGKGFGPKFVVWECVG